MAGPYRIVYSTCVLHVDRNRKPPELYVTFASGESVQKAHFRGPLLKILKEKGIAKSIHEKILVAIEGTVPTGTTTFRVKRITGGLVYSIHPEHLERWADRIKEKLEEGKGLEQDFRGSV